MIRLGELIDETMAEDLVSKAKEFISQHFGFKRAANREPDNVNEAFCKLYLMKAAASGGNTSNLHTHTFKHTARARLRERPSSENVTKKVSTESQTEQTLSRFSSSSAVICVVSSSLADGNWSFYAPPLQECITLETPSDIERV